MPVKFFVPVNTGNLNVSDVTTVNDLVVNGNVSGIDISDISGLQSELNTKISAADVQSSIATAVADLVGSAPGTLDTLGEIAAALDNDANLGATLMTAIGQKADASALASLATIVDSKASITSVTDLQTQISVVTLMKRLKHTDTFFENRKHHERETPAGKQTRHTTVSAYCAGL